MWAQVLTPQFLILLEVEVVQAGWDLRDTITRVEFHHSLLLIIINIVHLSSSQRVYLVVNLRGQNISPIPA